MPAMGATEKEGEPPAEEIVDPAAAMPEAEEAAAPADGKASPERAEGSPPARVDDSPPAPEEPTDAGAAATEGAPAPEKTETTDVPVVEDGAPLPEPSEPAEEGASSTDSAEAEGEAASVPDTKKVMLAVSNPDVDNYIPQSGPLPKDCLPRAAPETKITRRTRKPAGEREVIQRRQKKADDGPKSVQKVELGNVHRFLVSSVASLAGVTEDYAIDQLSLSAAVDAMDHILPANTNTRVLLFSVTTPKKDAKPTIKVSMSPDNLPKSGLCVYAVRVTKKAITTANMADEIFFGSLPLDGTPSGLIKAFSFVLQKSLRPMIRGNGNWGKMVAEDASKDELFSTIDGVITTLENASTAVETQVHLSTPEELRPILDSIKGPADYALKADSPPIVEAIEAAVDGWCVTIEGVIADSEQIRSEADNVGPHAELQHWKARTASFNSLVDQMKLSRCVNAIGVLRAAKSKVEARWRVVDHRITEESNEAKDNVKYLKTLDHLTEPLYDNDLDRMQESLGALINAVAMIHSVSRFYNTQVHMSALFVKITNQMITSSKAFVYRLEPRLWEQDVDSALASLAKVKELHRAYQECFLQEKAKLEKNKHGQQFDFSVMSIFGKSIIFVERIEKIEKMLTLILQWTKLENCRIDGVDIFRVSFRMQLKSIKSKAYDPLDIRSRQFEDDYAHFMTAMDENLAKMQAFCDSFFTQPMASAAQIGYLERFNRLSFLGVSMDKPYQILLNTYHTELQETRRLYQTHREDPALPRDMPPMAGRIFWARQLFKRIERVMAWMQQACPQMLQDKSVGKMIKLYNKLGKAFLDYELAYYNAWCKAIGDAENLLRCSLLVPVGDSGQLAVNWDPQVMQLIQETKFMRKLHLAVPASASHLLLLVPKLKATKLLMEELVDSYTVLVSRTPERLSRVMAPVVNALRSRLNPGMNKISWMSVNVDAFLETARVAMEEFDVFLKQINGVVSLRIDRALDEIKTAQVVAIPEGTQWTAEEFLTENERLVEAVATSLDRASAYAEIAVEDLVVLISSRVDKETQESEAFQADLADLRGSFVSQLCHSVIKCIRTSLDHLKRNSSSRVGFDEESSRVAKTPIFKSFVVLGKKTVQVEVKKGDKIEHVTQTEKVIETRPTLAEIQEMVTTVADRIVKVANAIPTWGQNRKTTDKSALKTHYELTKTNKEVQRILDSLSTIVNQTKGDMVEHQESFNVFSDLWNKDRTTAMAEFLKTKPTLWSFEEEVEKYEAFEQRVEALCPAIACGAIILDTSKIKENLLEEIKAWKDALGTSLNSKSSADLDEILAFSQGIVSRLERPINDLEDVRLAMECLKEMRDNEIKFDAMMGPIEQGYAMLIANNVKIPRAEQEKLDSMTFAWRKMTAASKETTNKLVEVQPLFRDTLSTSIETFQKDQASFTSDYTIKGPMQTGIKPQEANERLSIFQTRFDELWKRYITFSAGEEIFGLPKTEYLDLVRIKKELNLLNKLYGLYDDVIKGVSGFYDIKWVDVDAESINAQLLDFSTRTRKLPKALKEWDAYLELEKTINNFTEVLPLLEAMAHPAVLPRHWKRMEDACGGYTFDVTNPTFELRGIMEGPIFENKEDLEDICIGAVKEQDIEAKLKAVIKDWSSHVVTFSTFKSRGELLVKAGDISELVAVMEDSLMVLSGLMSNRYNAPFKAEIQAWVRNLSDTSEILEKWLIVQNLWVYLEAVFVGGDIAKQLPKEAKRFTNIDKGWQKIMQRAHENVNLIQCCVGDDTMATQLPHLLEQLELCQKSLTGYLEKKRLVFPRFFFVSDPVLLEILGQASDSHTIQDHMPSLFDNVHHVTFNEKVYDQILSFHSSEGEEVQMTKPVMAQGSVETWIGVFLVQQQKSLAEVIADATLGIQEEGVQLIDFMNTYPSQVGILGIQVLWTKESEEALEASRYDKSAMTTADDHFLQLLSQLIENTLADLTKLERRKFETLVTLHVHQRDIFHDDIVGKKVRSPNDFEWNKQARFYINADTRKLRIIITDWVSKYCLEFIGCVERLCVTPLTDRCYITLGQALLMSMGGAPAGPAGTGKTETTKDMGRALGKYVVVFNCSDQMDFRGLGRIYKGLAQSGSWGCFDEFNRIELPVLSVAAQQIKIVLQAKLLRKKRFIFMDGDDVSLDPEFGLFLTMNPGYAGRQELPENLKIQFRCVAMMKPDRQIIIRVKLASCGFQNNVVLARKFYTLYCLCEEQLTKQVHYDFGLRNILSVVRTLGAAKRQNPDDSEMTVVMRVLRDMNLSKMVDQDEPLFLSLIADLFPGIVLDTAGYPELEAAIDVEIQKAGLINHPPWTLKLIQLYETQRVRHGYMVLGPSGAGKTATIECLTKAMTATGTPHKELRMNPKAITAPQMFGRLDAATNDWTDGIFSTLWRRSLKAKKGEKIWIVLDGPIDAVWIENLNSVLDDNKLLTLANGDRIPMSPDAKLVFEPHNVDNASPATVSRNGMVFMSSSALDWVPILDSWLKSRPATEAEPLRAAFHESYNDVQVYGRFSLKPKMVLLECNYIKQACDLLTGLIPKKDDGTSITSEHIRKLYVFAVMWSVGAVLELSDRARLQEFMVGKDMDLPPLANKEESIFDWVVSENGEWVPWSSLVEKFDYPTDPNVAVPVYTSILVPNVDNVRTNFLLDCISKQRKAVLLMGESGTAKTVIVKGYAANYKPEEHLFKSFNFSSTSTPNGFQRTIESYVDKRMGTTYGPPSGRRMTVFIDDINMPLINEWKDQIANEIVRQTMATSGFYSLDKPGEFTTLADLQWIGAMPHPGGGRNDIPERLKRQFSVFNCTLPSNNSIETIFRTISEGWFCAERGFKSEVVELVPKLVAVTRRIWQDTKTKMLPTPAKFHYVFNLRDMSRIYQGMLKICPEECPDVSTVISLWRHEVTRVLADRFTELKDVAWFNQRVNQNVREDLGAEIAGSMHKEPYFVNFLRDPPESTGDEEEESAGGAPKIYEMVPEWETLLAKLTEYMNLYNETVRGAKMDLVFFKDCVVHACRLSRIISTDSGNALLVGVGGSGKQSVCRLASAVAGYSVFQITLSRTYNSSDLLNDIKELYIKAGSKGEGVTFILTDNEIKSEGFLEYINNMLATGEIGGLIPRDELDEITNGLINPMKRTYPKRAPTNEALYDFFIERVKANLHTCLCFSPVTAKFRQRALKFPAVFTGCTMDWYMAWPKDALCAVADYSLGQFEISCTPEVKKAVVSSMGVVQDLVGRMCDDYFDQYRRRTFVTPASYLSFLNGYRDLYAEKKKGIDVLANQMKTGLAKLAEAGESVATLSVELEVKDVELQKANKETEKVLIEVTASSAAAEKKKAEVQVIKDRAQAIVDAIDKDKVVAEAKLAAAVPALAAAEKALETISAADISTVKKLGKPPHLVKRIMDVVIILFGAQLDPVTADDDIDGKSPVPTWSSALKVMSGPMLQQLMSFNKDTISEEMVELCEVYTRMEDYSFDRAKKVAGAVAGLTSWTEAMCTFYWINKEVLPLKANLAVAEVKLAAAQSELNAAQAILDEKQAELDKVQAMYDATMKKKKELQDDADSCQRKMSSASALIEGLGGEKVRWTEQSKMFDQQITNLVGDVITMVAFMSYSGPFNADFRGRLLQAWENQLVTASIPFTTGMNLVTELVDNVTASDWALQGLPVDPLSMQNGIITTKATRYALMIDPQGQGKAWIKSKEKENQLTSTKLDHKYFRSHLEDALANGRPLLIEDVGEELDPCLDNVLAKNFIKSGSTFKVKVGDKECDVATGFQLYVTTKLANPAYTPEIFAATSIIDFTVTMQGLEDQLLARTIQFEKSELEEERVALATEVAANKKKMKELEDNLLYKLVNTKGSLVDDESLIQVLQTTKVTAVEVNEKIRIANETTDKISTAREEYRPIAIRGSILYFLIVELSMVNPMYQTSLDQFVQVFNKSLNTSAPSPVPQKRIHNIIELLTYETYCYTIRGLYTRDKFLLTILLALKIDIRKGTVKMNEFEFFIKGGGSLDMNAVEPKPKPWILDLTWLNLVQLSSLDAFADLTNQVARNDKAWKAWFDESEPEECPIPDGYDKISVLEKLLLIRAWCPDRITSQARKYIAASLGERFAESVITDLKVILEESSPRTPSICFLSLGSDPTQSIMDLAKDKKLDCRDISMGQGQEIHARRLVTNFQENGGWVLLQNCHLCLSFLAELQTTVQDAEKVHDDFRLWITTEEHPKFPINLLQSSLKFTNEPPQGIKAGIKRTYGGITQDKLDISSLPQWRPMLFGVAVLHSVVQERRKFGPLGWNIPYEFNAGDLYASIQMVQNAMDDFDPKRGVLWSAIRYHLGEVQYGGRVTDDRDKRLLNTFAENWFKDDMFEPGFSFAKAYPMFNFPKVESYFEAFEELPPVDRPAVFGLHANADITCQSKVATATLETILDIQPKDSGGGGGETREETVGRMCNEFLAKLPPDFVKHEYDERLKAMGFFTPLNIFLRQEIERMQIVISTVRFTLKQLLLAIDGTIVMSDQLANAFNNMYDARVPTQWESISWLSATLGFWFTELTDRQAQFYNWCFNGRPNAFWMTGFFNATGFITAMRQEITRAHKGWALDTVVMANDVTKIQTKEEVNSPPKEGVYIYGLFVDGAGWNKRDSCLCEQQPKVLYVPLPLIHLYAINSTSGRDTRMYECPIYKKPRRTDLEFIAMVDLKTGSTKDGKAIHPNHWTLRGTALLCDTK